MRFSKTHRVSVERVARAEVGTFTTLEATPTAEKPIRASREDQPGVRSAI